MQCMPPQCTGAGNVTDAGICDGGDDLWAVALREVWPSQVPPVVRVALGA